MNDKSDIFSSIETFGEGMPGGFFIYKAGGDEELLYANRVMVELFGCDDLEDFRRFVGNSFRGIVYPDDYVLTNHSIDIQVKTEQVNFDHVVYRIKRKDGQIRWINDYGRLVELEGYGKVFYVFVSDDTDSHASRQGQGYDKQVEKVMDDIHVALGSGDWSMDFDENGEMISCTWSAKFRQMIGYSSVLDFPNRLESWSDLLNPEDKDRVLNCFWEVIRDRTGRKTYDVHYRLNTKDRGERWFRAIGRLTRQEDGTPISFYGIFLDVDDEQRSKLEEKAATENLIEALSSTYNYTYVVDMTKGTTRPVHLERRIYELNGNYAEEHPYAIAEYAQNNVYPDDRHLFEPVDSIEKCRKFFEDKSQYTIPYRLVISGELHYMELQMVKPSADRDEFAMGFKNVDQQELIRQVQIRQQREQLGIIRSLSSEYLDLFLINAKTRAFRVLQADGVGLEVTNEQEDAEAALLKYIDTYVVDEDRDEMLKVSTIAGMERTVPETGIYSTNYRRKNAGVPLHFQLNIARFRADDGTGYFVHGFRNVTPMVEREVKIQKALQDAYDAAEAASHAKGDFLQTMSHDIRTPMNGIIGMTAIAAAHIDDKERVKDSLQKITVASKHLLSLINEVLDMSKIESGKVSLTEEDFNLSELVDNMITMVRPDVREHGHDFTIHIGNVEHEQVVGDSLRVQQVFMNMMSNAIKYTPDGGKIGLAIREIPCQQLKTGCYEFTFSDNGIGMSEEYISHIFEPFTRAEDGRINKIQGTGLGMPIARNIVRMMGGDIKVKSKLGEGSTFIVTIYLKLQDTEEIDYERFIDLPVLVADDDELSMESAVSMLEELGMKADGVLSGEEALDKVILRHSDNADYHAVILDWKMPGMDGVETARAIRKEVGDAVPIIVLSAYDWTEIETEARAAGVNAFVSKPLFKSRLIRLFHEVLGVKEEKVKEEKVKEDSPLQSFEEMDLSGYRCLLAEDNELNAEIAIEILEESGIAIDWAHDGAEAVEMISNAEDGKYDLVLMDIQMPKLNGYDATRAIRAEKRPYCKRVPIVAMSANAFAEDVQAAKTAGMNEHIAKPIDLNVLAKVISKYVLKEQK